MANHLFKPGQSGNPKGRPKGTLSPYKKEGIIAHYCNDGYHPLEVLKNLSLYGENDMIRLKAAELFASYIIAKVPVETKSINDDLVVISHEDALKELE